LVIVLSLAINGCGFRPLYGRTSADSEGYPVESRLAAVQIEPIADRLGQYVHNYLRDGMNPMGQPKQPVYFLSVQVVETNPGGLSRRDLGASRLNVQLRAYFALRDAEYNVLLNDTAKAVTGFDVFRDPLNDISAKEDAEKRTAELLAQMITARVAAYFSIASAPQPQSP